MEILKKITSLIDNENKTMMAVLIAVVILSFGLMFFTGGNEPISSNTLSAVKSDSSIEDDDFASVLSAIDGAGLVNLFVTYVDADKTQVKGVIIVAEGASDINVVFKLQSAAATAYGISIDQIEVFEMKGVSTQ